MGRALRHPDRRLRPANRGSPTAWKRHLRGGRTGHPQTKTLGPFTHKWEWIPRKSPIWDPLNRFYDFNVSFYDGIRDVVSKLRETPELVTTLSKGASWVIGLFSFAIDLIHEVDRHAGLQFEAVVTDAGHWTSTARTRLSSSRCRRSSRPFT